MEGIKKQQSISRIFALYIVLFCWGAILIATISFFVNAFCDGILLPANYFEKYVEKNRTFIAEAETVKTFVPQGCSYAVYDFNGKMIEGNVSADKAVDIWRRIKNDDKIDGNTHYSFIQRKDGVCAVGYRIKSQFANPVLREHLPDAENYFVLLYVVLFFTEIFILSRFFRRRLMKEMQILKDTTENIQMENLDFDIQHSNILEINEVLDALDKMKTQLQKSLNKQWKMEQARKEQIAALAHDIKTPLTIVRGNAELLNESDLNQEQKNYIRNVLNENDKMEAYIRSLIEIMKSEQQMRLKSQKIDTQSFINSISEEGNSIALGKGLKFVKKTGGLPQSFTGDETALQRAIINVISNAADYSPLSSEILFSVYSDNKRMKFVIEDHGRGFTDEELKYAFEQFYQGDKSRSSKNHYGMGLYIAKQFIKQHNGNIYLDNSNETGGAKVTLEIPV